MKFVLYALLVSILLINCNSSKRVTKKTNATKSEVVQSSSVENDTVRIANDDLEYEIIIIDPGFNSWLATNARQRGFYGQSFLENRNQLYVIAWNQRVMQPQSYNPNLYELQINYDPNIDYGYEVNYLLYNYFIYFQITYNQRLGPFIPRI